MSEILKMIVAGLGAPILAFALMALGAYAAYLFIDWVARSASKGHAAGKAAIEQARTTAAAEQQAEARRAAAERLAVAAVPAPTAVYAPAPEAATVVDGWPVPAESVIDGRALVDAWADSFARASTVILPPARRVRVS